MCAKNVHDTFPSQKTLLFFVFILSVVILSQFEVNKRRSINRNENNTAITLIMFY